MDRQTERYPVTLVLSRAYLDRGLWNIISKLLRITYVERKILIDRQIDKWLNRDREINIKTFPIVFDRAYLDRDLKYIISTLLRITYVDRKILIDRQIDKWWNRDREIKIKTYPIVFDRAYLDRDL